MRNFNARSRSKAKRKCAASECALGNQASESEYFGMRESRRLGQLLLEKGLIKPHQLEKALETQAAQGGRIGSILVRDGALREESLLNFLSSYFDLPMIDLRGLRIEPEVLRLLSPETVKELGILPMKIRENADGERTLMIAMIDPANVSAIRKVESLVNMRTEVHVMSYHQFQDALRKFYEEGDIAPRGYENAATRPLLIGLIEALAAEGILSPERLLKHLHKSGDKDD
jgi:hypothetical protein